MSSDPRTPCRIVTRRRSLVAAAALLVSVPVLPQAAHAQSVDDQRREVERLVDELERLHERSDILAEDYAVAMDDQRRLNGDIEIARARVAERQSDLASLQGDLGTVAVRAFTRSGTDVLGPLLSNAAAYADDLTRDSYSRVALRVGAGTVDDLGAAIRSLELEQQELNRLLDESEALAGRLEGMIDEVEASTSAYESARADAERKLGRLIEEEERRRSEAAFARLQRELAAGQASGADAGFSGAAAEDSQSASFAANYPAPSGLAGVAIQAALGQLGVPYRYATANPGVSFDCSGLTYFAWAQAGVSLPRNSRMQADSVPRVPIAAAQPGDLLFYYSPISHVGIYLGNGQLVHAPNSSTHVKVSNVNWSKVVVVGRPG
ncbi:MAG: NlpC/P60 family protein [Ilumatobacteraceae bacterium]|jgi:cell wall-associated NlpC family hydrolase